MVSAKIEFLRAVSCNKLCAMVLITASFLRRFFYWRFLELCTWCRRNNSLSYCTGRPWSLTWSRSTLCARD